MKKRVLSLLLCLVMALSLVPGMAFAETETHYNVWVGGVEVTSANAKDVLGDGKVAYVQSSSGPEYGGTLHLRAGTKIRGAYEYAPNEAAAIYAKRNLAISFSDGSAIDMADYYDNVSEKPTIFYGICGEGTVRIQSSNTDNTLTINMPKVSHATGIYAKTWVDFETFGQTVDINLYPNTDSYGIYTNGEVGLSGGVVHIANASWAPITADEIDTNKQYVYRGKNLYSGEVEDISQSEAASGYGSNGEVYDPITVEPIFPDGEVYKYMFSKYDTDDDKVLSKSELAAITYLELKDISIYKLDGLRYLPNLTILSCRGTDLGSFKLKELDVTHNPKLEKLYCDRNSLTSLDVSHCPELKTLDCGYNALTALDVTHNPKLTSLDCSTSRSYTSKISKLDVTKCPELTYLYCSDNDLSSLNLVYCPKLEKLLCDSCKLKSLNVEYNPKLTYLNAELNHLSTVNLANNPELTYLDLGGNSLAELDISHNTKLQKLYCYSAQLTTLDTSKCPDLQLISAAGGELTALDVSKNTKLTTLAVSANKLTSLDVSHNPQLTYLSCHDNQLTKLDLSNNSLLSELECYANRISELDLTGTPIADSSDYSKYENIYLGEQKDAGGNDISLTVYTLPSRVDNLKNYVKSAYSYHNNPVLVVGREPAAPATHKVTFNMNGYGTAPAAQTVSEGSKATKPAAPTASGYIFGGWYKDAACITAFDFNTPITADTAVYAKWSCAHASTKATTTKATLSANGKVVNKCSVCGKTISTKTAYMPKTFSLSYTKTTYNGKVKAPTVTVKDSKGNVLKKGTDYTVTYATGRKAVGTYKVTIKGIGKYSFTKTLSFKIDPAATKIVSATNVATKSIKVKWSKAAGAGGYQVKYVKGSTTKTVTVKGASTLTKTLTKLTKGSTYKVYVRSYKTVNSTNYYSAWSAYKSVKVAK